MNLARSTDGAFLNRVVNDPPVHDAISLGSKDAIDLAAAVADERNVFLANEFGGFLLMNHGGGMYDLHTQFLPEGRGKIAIEAAIEGCRYMFVETDCIAMSTFIALGNRAALRLAKWMRFEKVGDSYVNNVAGEIYMLTIKRWVQEFKCQPHQR